MEAKDIKGGHVVSMGTEKPQSEKKAPASPLGAARCYMTKGWQPVPIHQKSKQPTLEKWTELKTTLDELPIYFKDESNVGLALGTRSNGLLDVDVDNEYARRIACRYLPATGMRHGRASNPDSHYWYVCAGELGSTVQFKTTEDGMIIELRSTGGQTIVPPSIHPDGDHLEWAEFGEPGVTEYGELLNSVRKIAAITVIAMHWPQTGSRNAAAMALSGMLLRGGMTDFDAENFLLAVAEAANDEEAESRQSTVASTRKNLDEGRPVTGYTALTGLVGEKPVDTACRWLQEAGQLSHRVNWDEPILFDTVTPPDIPAKLLPGVFGEFAEALAKEAETPEALPVFAILGVLSTALAKRVIVSPKPNWEEPINIYTMVALPPGNNKSLILRRCTEPLVETETELRRIVEPMIIKARSTRRSEEKHVDHLRGRASRENDCAKRSQLYLEISNLEANLTPVPASPQFFATDMTPEALATAVCEQDGRFAILSDEGGIVETLSGLYSNGVANIDVLLKGIDGGQVRIRRQEKQYEVRPHISLVLIVQPQILRNLADKRAFQGNGLMERFLFVLPPSTLGYRKHLGAPVSKELATAYSSKVGELLAQPSSKNEPIKLGLSAEASAAWTAFRTEIEIQLRPEGRLHPLSGWGGKLPGYTLRIAGLLNIADKGIRAKDISGSTMVTAIKIASLLIEHALSTRELISTDQALDDAKAVLAWIVSGKRVEFTRSECLSGHRGRFTGNKRMDRALDILVDRNIISREQTVASGKAGRPTRKYDVNPGIIAASDRAGGANNVH